VQGVTDGSTLRLCSRSPPRYELGRVAGNTKLVPSAKTATVRRIRVRGGAFKFRALRLDSGNFAWPSEACTRKTRVLDVAYNASNNELVRTQTLVKGAVVQVDATPFRQYYAQHYGLEVGVKKGAAKKEGEEKVPSAAALAKRAKRVAERSAPLDPLLEEQFMSGRLYAIVASRPGQCGRCDGYILEGKELEFYAKKMLKKKGGASAK
jgi:small subunit ribosomal protein S8e